MPTLLAERCLLSIAGADAASFLQGLITNDIHKSTIYSCLLTPQGKFLADFFVVRQEDVYMLDLHRDIAQTVHDTLLRYRLRAKVTLTLHSDDWQIFSTSSLSIPPTGAVHFVDPRLPALGTRLWVPTAAAFAYEAENNFYHQNRIQLGVAEGIYDLISGQSFPPEFGLDQLHAIDYEKGCYLGQELIARAKYRGTLHKSLYIVEAPSPLQPGLEIVTKEGHVVGKTYSCMATQGLAIIRHEAAGEPLFAVDQALTAHRPSWWEV